jgi:hypothetical protein
MVKYPSIDIHVDFSDSTFTSDSIKKRQIEDVRNYLKTKGELYYQNYQDSYGTQHYFMGNSVVVIEEFERRADIKITAFRESHLDSMERNIRKRLK